MRLTCSLLCTAESEGSSRFESNTFVVSVGFLVSVDEVGLDSIDALLPLLLFSALGVLGLASLFGLFAGDGVRTDVAAFDGDTRSTLALVEAADFLGDDVIAKLAAGLFVSVVSICIPVGLLGPATAFVLAACFTSADGND